MTYNWMTTGEVAIALGIKSDKTIVRMMKNGDFPGYRIGSSWQFLKEDIEAYIESCKYQGVKKYER